MEIDTFKLRVDKLRNIVRKYIQKVDQFIQMGEESKPLNEEGYKILDEIDSFEYDIKKNEQIVVNRSNVASVPSNKPIVPLRPPKLPPKISSSENKNQNKINAKEIDEKHPPIAPIKSVISNPSFLNPKNKEEKISGSSKISSSPMENLKNEMLSELQRLKTLMKT